MDKFDTIFKQDGERSIGIYPMENGTYLALTYTWSKYFKTYSGAERAILKRCNFDYIK